MASKELLVQALQAMIAELREKHNLSDDEIQEILNPQQTSIPLSAFVNDLTPLESAVRVLDAKDWEALGRPASTLKRSLKSSLNKHPKSLDVTSKTRIPAKIFSDDKLSPLEALCTYLSEQGMRNVEIASSIHKDSRTVWTVISQAKKKRGERK